MRCTQQNTKTPLAALLPHTSTLDSHFISTLAFAAAEREERLARFNARLPPPPGLSNRQEARRRQLLSALDLETPAPPTRPNTPRFRAGYEYVYRWSERQFIAPSRYLPFVGTTSRLLRRQRLAETPDLIDQVIHRLELLELEQLRLEFAGLDIDRLTIESENGPTEGQRSDPPVPTYREQEVQTEPTPCFTTALSSRAEFTIDLSTSPGTIVRIRPRTDRPPAPFTPSHSFVFPSPTTATRTTIRRELPLSPMTAVSAFPS